MWNSLIGNVYNFLLLVLSNIQKNAILFSKEKFTHKKMHVSEGEKKTEFSILCFIVEKEKREEKEFFGEKR